MESLTNLNKQLPESEHYRSLASDGEVGPAKEFNDKEFFLRQVLLSDPEKGCELLFKRYYSVLCNHAVRMTYCKKLAEDIVADVFLKFWNRKMFQNITTSYRAYLFRAVRNTALNHLRNEFGTRYTTDIKEGTYAAATEDPHLIFEAGELGKLIEKTILALPQKCQTVFLMSRLEGRKNAEIAKQLGVSLKAVEAHISKALMAMRTTIKKRDL